MDQFKAKLEKGSSNGKSHGLPKEPVPVWSSESYLFPPVWSAIKSRVLSIESMTDCCQSKDGGSDTAKQRYPRPERKHA